VVDEPTTARDGLLRRIRELRGRINVYLSKAERRSSLLTEGSIVCGGLATLLTAAPAIGGPTFNNQIMQAFGTSSGWRWACAFASVLSFAATTAMTIYKSRDLANRTAQAQSCDAKLEGLETSLEFGRVELEKAADLYGQYAAEVAFIRGR
jgi:hypothetical protein